MAIVNCSTGCGSACTVMLSRAKSYLASYAVPHCPVFRLMMSFQASGAGIVHKVYFPAGTVVPPTTKSALVSNTVAWLAPVRHTWFQRTTLPKIDRPRVDGRLSRTESTAPATLVRIESLGESVPSERDAKDLP